MSKSNEEVNKEFDERFPESKYFENHSRLSFEGADNKVKEFITEIRASDRASLIKEVEEWAEKKQITDYGDYRNVEGVDWHNNILIQLREFLNNLQVK